MDYRVLPNTNKSDLIMEFTTIQNDITTNISFATGEWEETEKNQGHFHGGS